MKILLNKTESVFVEKKSKFIASLIPVKDEDDAINKLEEIKKKYYDARHNCYAYVVGIKKQISKSSDDGEPSGTAGKPMLSYLEGEKITNAIVIVTRYFGGILLGTGGLQKAYSQSAKLAIEEAKNNNYLKEVYEGIRFNIDIPYDKLGKIENFVKNDEDIYIVNKNFDVDINLELIIKNEKIDKIKSFLKELFSGDIDYKNEINIEFYLGSNSNEGAFKEARPYEIN